MPVPPMPAQVGGRDWEVATAVQDRGAPGRSVTPPQVSSIRLSGESTGGLRSPYVVPVEKVSGELQKTQVDTLKKYRKMNSHRHREHPSGIHHGAHHAEKRPSLLTAIPSAVINFLLMFGLCCAYGMIMFEDSWNARHRGLAVKMNLGSAMLVGLLLATRSKIKVAIGGPDLNPVVFLGMFVTSIAEEIAKEQHLSYPSVQHRRLTDVCTAIWEGLDLEGDPFRRLGSSSDSGENFCMGTHYEQHTLECDTYHAQLRATTVFAVSVSSLVFGLIYLSLGSLRLTRYVSYVPTNIMEAFLSCVGYKVFKYALKFCKFKLNQFVPAACVGVTLYILKANHFGNPAIVIPMMLLVPLGIFYAIVYGSGSNLSEQEVYMFPKMDDIEFWKIWTESFFVPEHINFKAWLKTLVDLPIMIIVVVLDCLLKLSSTENKLPVKTDKDYEMQLYGVGNILTSLCGSSVGYMQLKFNVINYGVLGNVDDRRGGAIYAVLCGVCFFYSIRLFNYLPRFFLGTLLFFAGAGFVAENLWGSRKYLSRVEWLQVVAVLAVFILLNSLLYAVIVGGLLVGAAFIAKYANIPCIAGAPTRGASVFSTERRELLVERNMQHIADRWLLLIRLKGYIFFASAQSLIAFVNKAIDTEAGSHIPEYRRLRFVIFDCKLLDSMDSSAAKATSRLVANAQSKEVRILWSNVSQSWADEMKPRGLLTSDNDWFESLENAISYIDRLILNQMKYLEERWLQLHPTFELIDRLAEARRSFGPLSDILATDAARFGCPWQFCGRINIHRSKTLLWRPGDLNVDLFLVSSGRVGLFAEIPGEKDQGELAWSAPLAIYGHGWFLNRDAVHHKPARHYAVALDDGELLFWNEHQRSWMSRERPEMASAIMKMVLRQEAADAERLFAALSDGKSEATATSDGPGRRSSKVSTGMVVEEESGEPKVSSVPEELEREVRGISIAKALDGLGLYSPIATRDTSVLPSLPPRIWEDLHIAFHTYCIEGSGKDGETLLDLMPWDRVSDALMYAGLFNTLLTNIGCKCLSKDEFLAVGHAAAMTRLSDVQVGRLEEIFGAWDKQGLGIIGCEMLTQLFRENVSSTITVADVDGVASLWYKEGVHEVTVSDFVGIMSRFIKIHESDWFLLCGLRHLGIDHSGHDLSQNGVLTPDMLVAAKNGALHRSEAEEMIWTADFSGGKGQGETLDCRLVAAAILSSEIVGSTLPPPPKMVPREIPSTASTDGHGSTFDEVDVGGIVVELRTVVPSMLPAMSATTHDRTMEAVKVITSARDTEEDLGEGVFRGPYTCRQQLYLLLEEPSSSKGANVVSLVMGLLILIAVMTLVSEPLISPEGEPRTDTEETVWLSFECFFTVVFTLEFLLRLSVADAMGTSTQCRFLRMPMTICDIAAVMPFYIELAIKTDSPEFRLLRVVRLLRLSRVMRLGRLANKSQMFASIAVILTVIWGIYMKTGLNDP